MADFDLAFAALIAPNSELVIERKTREESRYGVTLEMASGLGFCEPGDVEYVRQLTEIEASRLFFETFWSPLLLSGLKDQAVAAKVFDMAQTLGVKSAVTLLQRAVNELGGRLSVSGKMDSFTFAAINAIAEPWQLVLELKAGMLSYFAGMVDRDPALASSWETLKKRAER